VKGLAASTIILLLIGVITALLAILILKDVGALEPFFINDQWVLKQYSTCALAYCAAGGVGTNGQTSDEVNAVGCMKSSGGNCVLTCAQVEKEVYFKNNVKPTVYEVGGRGAPHYCGPEANLSFEFSGVSLGGVVPLASGQMDKLATSPQWVCKPIKVPFTNVDLDSIPGFNLLDTASAQFTGSGVFPQNCIILSGKKSFLFPGRDGCFQAIKYDKSYDSIYYTPIIEYDSGNQITYPSAIYVDRSFTEVLPGSQKPECNYRNAPNYNPVSDQQILDAINAVIYHPQFPGMPSGETYQQYYDELGKEGKTDEQKKLVDFINTHELMDLSSSTNNLLGNILNGCNFATSYQGKKITYYVWAKPVYPTIDALKQLSGIGGFQDFIASLLKKESPDFANGFSFITDAGEEGTKLIFSQLGGSCTSVILGRDLPQSSFSNTGSVDVIQDLAISTDQKTYPAGGTIKFSGQLVMTSGSASSKEITVDYIYPTLNGILQSMKAVTDNDGKFSGEFRIPSTGGGTGFILQAIFLDKKVLSEPFNIGG
jgi:hypothetical protein